MQESLDSVPKQLGQKFVFRKINSSAHVESLRQAITLLNKARLTSLIVSTAANGLPLGAEINEKIFKEIFLDVGLCALSLGLTWQDVKSIHDIMQINRGALAEQITGQLLRTIHATYVEPRLYYWQREKKGSEHAGNMIRYHLLSLPFYLLGQLPRLLTAVLKNREVT